MEKAQVLDTERQMPHRQYPGLSHPWEPRNSKMEIQKSWKGKETIRPGNHKKKSATPLPEKRVCHTTGWNNRKAEEISNPRLNRMEKLFSIEIHQKSDVGFISNSNFRQSGDVRKRE